MWNFSTQGKLLKTGEAAEILHVSPQTIRDWVESGKLKAQPTPGGHRNFHEVDVKRLALEEQGVNSFHIIHQTVAVDKDFNHLFLDSDWNQVSFNPETFTTDFDRYWDFKNGLESYPRNAVLNNSPSIVPPAISSVFVCELPDNPVLAYTTTVVGLDEKEAVDLMSEAVEHTFLFLKENFKPKVAYEWLTRSGTRMANL